MGLKCRNCSLIGHEHCLQSSQHNLNECSGSSLILVNSAASVNGETSWAKSHEESGECSREAKNVGGQQSSVSHLSQLAQLDTSSYSVQTSSSCSTTPNSNYSQTTSSNQVGANSTNGGVVPQTTLNFQQHQYHGCKLDTDIGSACGMGFKMPIFFYHPTQQKNLYKLFFLDSH